MACGWQNSCRPWSCNYLQNVGATTYKNFLQFYAKKACKKHTVVENGGTYEKFNVKTPEIENAIDSDYIASNTQIFVEFENAICKLYTDANGRIQVSVKADAINIVG